METCFVLEEGFRSRLNEESPSTGHHPLHRYERKFTRVYPTADSRECNSMLARSKEEHRVLFDERSIGRRWIRACLSVMQLHTPERMLRFFSKMFAIARTRGSVEGERIIGRTPWASWPTFQDRPVSSRVFSFFMLFFSRFLRCSKSRVKLVVHG
ncbi:uncharacterized protein LOC143145749 [Ptiloglossa arizonensis]|uniref:uncharacterized protein LOC143145749 n=1 Tax=Ptiloglossa arizonensis TaxID=3350558 RepID=UPI003FA1581D